MTIEFGRQMPIAKGQVYVFDKGYCVTTNWCISNPLQEACFVTRLKSNRTGYQPRGDRNPASDSPATAGFWAINLCQLQTIAVPAAKRINEYNGTPVSPSNGWSEKTAGPAVGC